MKLNSAQKEAIETTSGPLLVLAGPGTGKTRVIISKIEYLASRGIAPDRILALTFSNKATEEMSERLAVVNASLAERVEVSTIHAWCLDLLYRHAFRVGFHRTPRLMTEAQSQLFFRQLAFRLPLEPFLKTAHVDSVLKPLLTLFSQVKDEGLWPEDLIQHGEKVGESEWSALGDIYNAYQTYCQTRGYIDFGDAILFARRLLEDHSFVRSEVQNSYDVILVDEFQDTNWSQVQLLRQMARTDAHICVVGDDDQSIYRFRGASYSAFRFFTEAFPGTKVVELSETYRLSPEIATTASTLIQANGSHRFRPEKVLRPQSPSAGPVRIFECTNYEDEAVTVAEAIERLLKENVSPGEIAVLVRSHNHSEVLIRELRNRKIPFLSSNMEALFDQPIIRDLLSFLRLLESPRSTVDFLRLLDSPFFQLQASEIYSICKLFEEKGKFPEEILENLNSLKVEAKSRERLQKFWTLFPDLKAHAARRHLSETLLLFFETTGVVSTLLERKNDDDLKNLARFHSQIYEWEKLHEQRDALSLLPLLESLFQHEISLESSEIERDADHIQVLTIHASKGLEFDHVFILSLVGRRFPANFQRPTWILPAALQKDEALTKEIHTQEERRLLYVGMTRARQSLNLTTVNRKGTNPSSFLTIDLKSLLADAKILNWKEIPERPMEEHLRLPPPAIFSRTQTLPNPSTDKEPKPLKLSFTQLDRYERCPLSYRFEYDLKIPVPPSPSSAFGSAIHSALEKFFLQIKQNDHPDPEILKTVFVREFDRERLENPKIPEDLKEMGLRQLQAFYDLHQGQFPKPQAIEEKFRLSIGEHLIVGKIDRVDSEPEGMVIVDYKTGKSKSSENEDHQDFADKSLQFSIYALAAKECFHWPLKELRFYYLADNTVLSTQRNSKDLEATKTKILSIAAAIQRKEFPAKPNRIVCSSCSYKTLCPLSAV